MARFLSILIILALMTGCGPSIPKNEMPDLGVSIEEANRDLEMYTLKGSGNTFRNGDRLTINIRVISEYPIHFPMDYGTKIYAYQEEQWIEIENRMVYPTVGQVGWENILPPSKDNILKEGTHSFAPYYPDLKKATPVRVIIVGNVMENGKTTDALSVGYFDFVLNP